VQHALELAYREEVAGALREPATPPETPAAHAVFCIDVRSEVFRRALEASDPRIVTLGFAGFFGLPFTYVDAKGTSSERLPALLRPDHVVGETAAPGSASTSLDAALHAIEQHTTEGDSKRRHLELALEQAHFEARRARRQYEAVDPDHRLVAAELERRWNEALAAVARLDEELTRQRTNDRPPLSPEQRAQLLALGADLERAWEHPAASPETRKRILRTVLKEIIVRAVDERLELKLHWQGGDHSELSVAKNRTGQHRWTTPDEIEELYEGLLAGGRAANS